MKVLSGRGEIDLERELHNVYRMFLEGQARLVTLKGVNEPFIPPFHVLTLCVYTGDR